MIPSGRQQEDGDDRVLTVKWLWLTHDSTSCVNMFVREGGSDLRLIGDDLFFIYNPCRKIPISLAGCIDGSLHLLPCAQIIKIRSRKCPPSPGWRTGSWHNGVGWRNCPHDSTLLEHAGTRKSWGRGHWPPSSPHQSLNCHCHCNYFQV